MGVHSTSCNFFLVYTFLSVYLQVRNPEQRAYSHWKMGSTFLCYNVFSNDEV